MAVQEGTSRRTLLSQWEKDQLIYAPFYLGPEFRHYHFVRVQRDDEPMSYQATRIDDPKIVFESRDLDGLALQIKAAS